VINVAQTARGNHPMGRDPRVREAFDLALDRQVIVDVAFAGRFVAGNQFVVQSSPYYSASMPMPKRDVAKAKQILREAGYTQPVPFEITVPNRPTTVRAAEVIQAMTNEAGFDTKLKVVEFATSLNLTDAGDFQAWGPIGPLTANDPDAVTYMSLHTSGSRNVGKYSNPEMDRLMEATRLESDPEKRKAIFQQAAALAAQDRAVLYLYHPRFLFAHATRVSGFAPIGDGYVFLRGIKLAP
jgi:peptide/nickel transport system substrate-binding protein